MLMPLVFVFAAYLIGAIPFGLLLGLARGVDVREHGSRNIGATNVGRTLGPQWGKVCLLLDILKGFLPVIVARGFLVGPRPSQAELLAWLAVGVAAVLGHIFPAYLGFRGGKGVATTIGVGLGIFPYFTISITVALLTYAVVRFSTGLVSLGSLALAAGFPAALYIYLRIQGLPLEQHWPLLAAALLLAALIVIRHLDNIRRLWHGEEMRPAAPGAASCPAERADSEP